MAEVAGPPRAAAQVLQVGLLRWRIFRNSLRTWRGRMEAISLVLVGTLLGLVAVAVGVGLGSGAFLLIRQGKTEWIGLPLWLVFLFWQVVPLFALATTVQFNFANLLRFPLRFSTFFILSLIYGLAEPIALVSMFWLLSIAAGVVIARPQVTAWIAPAVVLFAAANLALSRVAFAWLERWLAQRRTREVLVVVLLVGMMSVQLAGPMANRWGKGAALLARRVEPAAGVLPPGLAAGAIVDAVHRRPSGVLSSTAVIAAYVLGLTGLLVIRLRAQYRGEELGESQAPTAALLRQTGRVAKRGWAFGGLPSPVAAIVEKELRYLSRSGPMLLGLLTPVVMVVYFSFSFGGSHARLSLMRGQGPNFMLPLGTAFALLVLTNLIYNSLGFEGPGVQLLLVAPVRFRDVMLAKNLAHTLVSLVETGLVWIGVSVLLGPPGFQVAAGTLAALLFALPMNFAAGDVLSLYFPRRLEFGAFRGQRAAGVTVLASMVIQGFVMSVAGLIYFLVRYAERLWLAALIFLALAAGAGRLYVWALERCSRIALDRREVLTAELCREQGG